MADSGCRGLGLIAAFSEGDADTRAVRLNAEVCAGAIVAIVPDVADGGCWALACILGLRCRLVNIAGCDTGRPSAVAAVAPAAIVAALRVLAGDARGAAGSMALAILADFDAGGEAAGAAGASDASVAVLLAAQELLQSPSTPRDDCERSSPGPSSTPAAHPELTSWASVSIPCQLRL